MELSSPDWARTRSAASFTLHRPSLFPSHSGPRTASGWSACVATWLDPRWPPAGSRVWRTDACTIVSSPAGATARLTSSSSRSSFSSDWFGVDSEAHPGSPRSGVEGREEARVRLLPGALLTRSDRAGRLAASLRLQPPDSRGRARGDARYRVGRAARVRHRPLGDAGRDGAIRGRPELNRREWDESVRMIARMQQDGLFEPVGEKNPWGVGSLCEGDACGVRAGVQSTPGAARSRAS